MKATMLLVKVGPVVEREFKSGNDVKTIKSRMLKFSDGVDTILGETTERLCNRTTASNDDLKLVLIEGHVYTVEFTLNVRSYTTKDNKESEFFSCTITNVAQLV